MVRVGRICAQLTGLQSQAALPLIARAEGGGEAGVSVAGGRRYSGRGDAEGEEGGGEEGEEEDEAEEGEGEEGEGEEAEGEEGEGEEEEGRARGEKGENGSRKKSRKRREEKDRAREGVGASSGASLRRGVSYEEAERWVGEGAEVRGADVGKGEEVGGGEEVKGRGGARRGVEWPHVPVLVREVVGAFQGVRLNTFVDGTLGSGGHTLALARHHPELHTVVGLDVDPSAHAIAAARLHPLMRIAAPPRMLALQQRIAALPAGEAAATGGERSDAWVATAPEKGRKSEEREGAEGGEGEAGVQLLQDRQSSGVGRGRATVDGQQGAQATLHAVEGEKATLHAVEGNFRRMVEACGAVGVVRGSVDGILLDVGVSSMQIDRAERGFSFQRDGPLDMRMDPKSLLTAEVAVNDWPEETLGHILRDLGEERRWRQVARRIVQERDKGRISSTAQLAAVVAGGAYGPRKGAASSSRRGGPGARIHPATRTFQALRIAVNDELAALTLAVPAALSLLAPGGRLAVISFHSLEDRIVKRSFLDAAAGVLPVAGAGVAVSEAAQWDGGTGLSVWLGSGQGVGGHGLAQGLLAGGAREAAAAAAAGAGAGAGSSDVGQQGQARYRVVTKRPVVADEDEWRVNSRSRSAKLRVIERVA
ncbi:hypothetical protein CLOM_g611 [Closterium sp. NIES-68]|nr:hypothetical protein CLOM_g611 [Closterium sp. NIES-68]GJP57590.1 hypothetical protein CLOP_g21003 [Closterium sp. NIES-67]